MKEYSLLYTTAYNICTDKSGQFSALLYKKYVETITDYLGKHVVFSIQALYGLSLLNALKKHWDNHKLMLKWLTKFFQYLDRFYVKTDNVPTLREKGLEIFKTTVFNVVKSKTTKAVLEEMNKSREKELVDHVLLKNVIDIYLELGSKKNTTYEEEFEGDYLKDVEIYFQRVASSLLSVANIKEYILTSADCLKKEEERVNSLMAKKTLKKMKIKFHEEVLIKPAPFIFSKEKGIGNLFAEGVSDELKQLFLLYNEIKAGMSYIVPEFRKEVIKEVSLLHQLMTKEEVKDNNRRLVAKDIIQNTTFIDKLLGLLGKFNKIIAECFANNSDIKASYSLALGSVLNKEIPGTTISDILCMFAEKVMTKSKMKISEEEVHALIENIGQIFSHIVDKDYFLEIYQRALANRLVFDLSFSHDAEKRLITMMKIICGPNFTLHLEGMLADMVQNEETKNNFPEWREELEAKSGKPLINVRQFDTLVLAGSHWPFFPSMKLNVPPEISECIIKFQEYYRSKFQHKTLSICFTVGTMALSYVRGDKSNELVCTTLQAIILLLFNSHDSLPFKQIVEMIGIPEDLCRSHLLSLLGTGHQYILEKSPPAKTILPTDVFSLSSVFASPLKRITLPFPAQHEEAQSSKISIDRSVAIEAGIVKVMKARKVLSHNDLINELVNVLPTFVPDGKMIKDKIEELITKDYLARDEKDMKIYKYVAN